MKTMFGIMALLICVLILVSFQGGGNANESFLRIHIRANSNIEADQSVKYVIKEKVVHFLMEPLSVCLSKEDAEVTLKQNLKQIEEVANRTLLAYGFSYECKAFLRSEYFPTRSYQELNLEGGVYDALILELGEATGDNWWCVVYPPLCFVPTNATGNQVVLKSKLLQIIQNALYAR